MVKLRAQADKLGEDFHTLLFDTSPKVAKSSLHFSSIQQFRFLARQSRPHGFILTAGEL